MSTEGAGLSNYMGNVKQGCRRDTLILPSQDGLERTDRIQYLRATKCDKLSELRNAKWLPQLLEL